MGKIKIPKQKVTAKNGKAVPQKATRQDINIESKLKRSKSVIVAKKAKIKMRRQKLLSKLDEVKQMKKALKLKEKRKTTAIMGDTNPLHDALPSLEHLVKNRPSVKQPTETRKKRGIEKQRRRKREILQGIKMYKSVLTNKTFLKDPLEAITQHVQVMVDQEKQKLKHNI